MKVTQCDWAPSLVVEWLCGELEERGIPGPTYAHTLLSLLHTHYCSHPPLSAGIGLPTSSLSRRQNSRHPRQLDPRHLNIEELIDDLPHPDADLPDLIPLTAFKCGGSRRARKRFRVRQKRRVFTSEELQKVSALQCLMSASDEDLQHYDLENLIEELCIRLKLSKEGEGPLSETDSVKNSKTVIGSDESGNDTDDSTPEELAQRYYAAFPPLSETCGQGYSEESPWKNQSCVCVSDGSKQVHESNCPNSTGSCNKNTPSAQWKDYNTKEEKDMLCKPEDSSNMDSSDKQYEGLNLDRSKDIQNEELSTAESSLEEIFSEKHSRFRSSYVEDDIPEGYIGDSSSRESSEDRDKGEETISKKGKEYFGSRTHSPNPAKKLGLWEAWERASNLVADPKNGTPCHLPIPKGGAGRLFERCSTSGGTSGCSSDGETNGTTPILPETDEESMKLLEKKISNTVAQVWGQSSEQPVINYSSEHVWDPPSVQDLAFYNSNDVYLSRPPSVQLNPCNSLKDDQVFANNQSIPDDNWPMKNSLLLNHLVDSKNDPLFSSAFSCSPNNSLKSYDLGSINDHCMWPDYNANETLQDLTMSKSSSNVSIQEETLTTDASFDSEAKLCDSFQQLGLEQLWNNDNAVENIFGELSLASSSTEFSSQNVTDNDLKESKTKNMNEMVIFDEGTQDENMTSNKIDFDLLIRQIPAGPSGPHAVLKHTESSGFSTVVPRGKSADLLSVENLQIELNNSNSTSSSSIPASFTQDTTLDLALPPTEEENLLTSPRTHFKPIRQDSCGQKNDESSEESQTIVSGFQHPELAFQRTGSGALFLESDFLEGSPKKYMVYREPLSKTNLDDQAEATLQSKSINSVPLVPKFKVINNEKFSQTEGEQANKSQSFKKKQNKLAKVKQKIKMCKSPLKESEGFEFQQDCFVGLSDIWKNDSPTEEKPDNIWCLPPASYEMWKQDAPSKNKLKANSWLKDISKLESWSMKDKFEFSASNSTKSKSIDIPKISEPWSENTFDLQSSSLVGLKSLWSDLDKFEVNDKGSGNSEVINLENLSENHEINPSSFSYLPFGKSSEKRLWGPHTNGNDKISDASLWPSFQFDPQTIRSMPLNSIAKTEYADEHFNEVTKIDKEAEDFFCAFSKHNLVNPGSESTDSHSKTSKELDNNADIFSPLWTFNHDQDPSGDATAAVYSKDSNEVDKKEVSSYVWNMHHSSEHIDIHPNTSKQVDDESEFLSHLWSMHRVNDGSPVNTGGNEGSSVLPQEDLDHLEPGWELNEGFEWDQPHDDDGDSEDGGCEVLIYEADDGSTFTVPVEYLDDSFYDEIFGCKDKPIGGSLPDLPSGDSMQVRFSHELEEQWKKCHIPYKVQLPRKSRGRWLPPSRRPCSFFMEGNCKRPDCKFSHDLASITCRFWEEGSCLKGITCPFLHGYPLRRQRNRSEGSQSVSENDCIENVDPFLHTSGFEIDSETDFPSLSSSVESKKTNFEEVVLAASSSNGTTGKHRKKHKFITITRNVIGEDRPTERSGRFLRRRASRRQRRVHRNSETDTSEKPADENTVKIQHEKKQTPKVLKKLERHRASASGHDDGTVSDY